MPHTEDQDVLWACAVTEIELSTYSSVHRSRLLGKLLSHLGHVMKQMGMLLGVFARLLKAIVNTGHRDF